MKTYTAVVAAVVLAAGMVIGTAGAVLADNEGMGVRGTTQEDAWQVRGPIETGAVPGLAVSSEGGTLLNMDVAAQNWSPELRGRANIQAGP